MYNILKAWIDTMNSISPALTWLKKAGCNIGQEPDKLSLSCIEYVREARKQYECLGTIDGKQGTEYLTFFFRKPSKMFLKKLEICGVATPNDAWNSLKVTRDFFKKLIIFDEMTLDNLMK